MILGHPNEGSFNHAIAETTAETLRNNGYQVMFHDLYREQFEPILTNKEISNNASLEPIIKKHCAEVSMVDGIVIIHPKWWGQPPAILKGWVDRVFRPGVAYQFAEGDRGEGVPVGLLKARTALVFNTSNTLRERELDVFGDPLETLWKNCIFGLCGIKNFYRIMFGAVVTSTLEQRKAWLREVQQIINQFFPAENDT